MVCKFDASQCIAVLSPSQSCEAAAKAQAETLVGKGSEKRKLRCKGTKRGAKDERKAFDVRMLEAVRARIKQRRPSLT